MLALAANAAQVVTEETGIPATTIATWRVGGVDLPRNGLVIIDEASMVPTLTLRRPVPHRRRSTTLVSRSSATTPRWDHPKPAVCSATSPRSHRRH